MTEPTPGGVSNSGMAAVGAAADPVPPVAPIAPVPPELVEADDPPEAAPPLLKESVVEELKLEVEPPPPIGVVKVLNEAPLIGVIEEPDAPAGLFEVFKGGGGGVYGGIGVG